MYFFQLSRHSYGNRELIIRGDDNARAAYTLSEYKKEILVNARTYLCNELIIFLCVVLFWIFI